MKHPFSVYKGLDRRIYLMSLVTFINCLGEFVGPFFSLYLTTRLGYDLQTTGLLVSLLVLCHIPGALLGGKLCDRMGRKTVIVISQTLMGISFLLCGFLMDRQFAPLFVFFGMFFDGITDPARNALQVDVTRPEERQRAFSLIYQTMNMGFVIGPMLAGFLFVRHTEWLFFGNGLAEVLSVLLIVFFVSESRPSETQVKLSREIRSEERAEDGSTLKALFARPQLLWLSAVSLFVSFAYSQLTFSLPLQTTALFGDGGAAMYGSIISVNATIVILCNPLILSVSNRIPVLTNVLVGCGLYPVAFFLFGFASVPLHFYLLTAVYTVGEIVYMNNFMVYQNNNTPINFRGRFNAVLPLFRTAGQTLGTLLGGSILAAASFVVLWTIAGASVVVGIGIILFLRIRSGREE